jgi:FkbM family methyltransferase
LPKAALIMWLYLYLEPLFGNKSEMRGLIKKFLQSKGVYEHLKYSKAFAAYEHFFKPQVQEAFKKELAFYRSFLQPCQLVFDIGANDGHKTEAFLRIAERVVCCEPDAKNHKTLVTRFRNRKERVLIEKLALGAKEGELKMYVHHEGSAFNTLNPKFKAVTEADNLEKWSEKIQFERDVPVKIATLDSLIEKYGQPYFIKIDVEGYELEVVKGLKQAVPYLSLECLLPEFESELRQSVALLQNLAPVEFNIAIHEKLIFEEFKPADQLENFIASFKDHHFELIVRMDCTPA